MARKRFNTAEKTLIESAGNGGLIEWQNVTQWHPAVLQSGEIVTEDGWQHVKATNLAATRTVGRGQTIYVSPGHIRAAI